MLTQASTVPQKLPSRRSKCFSKMSKSRPLFVFISTFSLQNSNINWKSIDVVLEDRTRGHRMAGTDGSTDLWPDLRRSKCYNAKKSRGIRSQAEEQVQLSFVKIWNFSPNLFSEWNVRLRRMTTKHYLPTYLPTCQPGYKDGWVSHTTYLPTTREKNYHKPFLGHKINQLEDRFHQRYK